MGYKIVPECKTCGYRTKAISVGAGKFNHLIYCGCPALNIETNEIEQINLFDYVQKVVIKKRFLYLFFRMVIIEKIDMKYVPYYDTKMFSSKNDNGSYQWMDKFYKKSDNLCPKCKSYNLDFKHTGIWFD